MLYYLGRHVYQPLNEYLSIHNSAIEIKRGGPISIIRTKKILVPFEETVPYPKLLGWIRRMVGTLGGFTFSYLDEGAGFVNYRETKATPLICYEILFGSEVARLSKQSDVFFLLLNEGWYHSETGAKQFLYYTSLRAVETRRSIGRSSNMGISAIIDETGTIVKKTGNILEPAIINGYLNKGHYNTLYSSIGDLLGVIASVGLLILSLTAIAKGWKKSI